jgi:LysR substrate binding domain
VPAVLLSGLLAAIRICPLAATKKTRWPSQSVTGFASRRTRHTALVAGMSTSPGRGGLLAAIRSRFTALHPEATVQLRQVSWDDPTAGLADSTVDVAFVWLPLPGPGCYRWVVVAEEPRLVAMPDSHRLASRDTVDFADLLDEPFLALLRSAGPLRDYWLAADARGGRPPRIGAEIASTDETYEALVDGRSVCLVAAGNAPLVTLGDVTTRPVHGISHSQLALAWTTTTRARSSWTMPAPAAKPPAAEAFPTQTRPLASSPATLHEHAGDFFVRLVRRLTPAAVTRGQRAACWTARRPSPAPAR